MCAQGVILLKGLIWYTFRDNMLRTQVFVGILSQPLNVTNKSIPGDDAVITHHSLAAKVIHTNFRTETILQQKYLVLITALNLVKCFELYEEVEYSRSFGCRIMENVCLLFIKCL